ncbi:hypothetical protein ABT352_09855 [Streptosporangium sp. NPDC000563]|uniref:hypothetical protein n=1 Tax=Streptosporangium sp. NPDC000563 TaxID=3154366 RepID=UPI003325CEA0
MSIIGKRFVVTDALGPLTAVTVRPAEVRDRAGATLTRGELQESPPVTSLLQGGEVTRREDSASQQS